MHCGEVNVLAAARFGGRPSFFGFRCKPLGQRSLGCRENRRRVRFAPAMRADAGRRRKGADPVPFSLSRAPFGVDQSHFEGNHRSCSYNNGLIRGPGARIV